ncbi:MAG: hypothetical protein R3F18_07975 [Lysobacterales bacterium]|nr:hypothetical protein [Rhodanobacteraceae bacterium]
MESRVDTSLKRRLLALPLETPPADAWAKIRARAEAPAASRRTRRTPSPWWLALAAGAAAIALLPSALQPPAVLAPAPAVAGAPVNALVQRSQALESEIRSLRAANPALAEAQYQWERAIENDLAVIDVGLAERGPQQAQLWRERVRLLEELKTATQMDAGPMLLQARLD